jgi:hypothetical protein
MRRTTWVSTILWTLLTALVVGLGVCAIRQARGENTVIASEINELVATFAISLQPDVETPRQIPGWATVTLLIASGGAALYALRAHRQRDRSNRS